MSKSSELLSKLKTSLPKATLSRTPESIPVKPIPVKSEVGMPLHFLPSQRAPKLSVSLFQSDVQRLDTIKEFMKTRGFRNLNDSEALRLACRSVEIGDHFVEVYRAMQQEDGRRRPEAKRLA